MVLLLFSRFNWHFSRSFHNNSILLNASVSCGAAWQMPVWCCQFDCFLKQLNSTCVCCFLLLLLLFLLNDLLKQFCYVYLCRSIRRHFKDKKEASVMHSYCNFAQWCLPVQEWMIVFIQNERLLFFLQCTYRCIMPAFSRLKIPFWKN